jgi:hypothetical protein
VHAPILPPAGDAPDARGRARRGRIVLVTDRIAIAARTNALWVDAVCRTHGLVGVLGDDAWTCPQRTPPYHPDAVTLSPDADGYELLARIDASDGCSVKDSWSGLDLSGEDFARLVVGEWLWLDPKAPVEPPTRRWEAVRTPDEMLAWASSWAADPDDAAILRPALLREPGVHVLRALEAGRVVAGGIVHVTDGVAGVGNLFDATGDDARAWRDVVAAVREIAPGMPVAGWEAGGAVAAAEAAGCERLGTLTIWIR